MKIKNWKSYIKTLSPKQKDKMLKVLLEYLIEEGAGDILSYREGGSEYPDEPPSKECIYWSSCGESIIK